MLTNRVIESQCITVIRQVLSPDLTDPRISLIAAVVSGNSVPSLAYIVEPRDQRDFMILWY